MEPSLQPQPATADVAGGSQVYPASAYLPAATVAVPHGVSPAGSHPAPPFTVNPAQFNAQNHIYEQAQEFYHQLQQQQQRPATADVAGGSQVYPAPASVYPPAATVAVPPGVPPAGSHPAPPFPVNPAQLNAQNQLIYKQAQQFYHQLQQQQQRPAMADVAGGSQVYPASAYPPAATVAVPPGVPPAGSHPAPPFPVNPAQINAQNQLIYEQAQQFRHQPQQQQQRQLQQFWAERLSEIEQASNFKNYTLPLTRIKKIMKEDEGVRLISATAPVVFAKVCEVFILELTLRSWMHTEENKRWTLQKNDIAAAITNTDVYDFLVNIIRKDELKEEGTGLPRAGPPPLGASADAYPYYYPLQQQVPGAAGAIVNGGHPTYAWQDPQEQQQGPHAQQQQSESG